MRSKVSFFLNLMGLGKDLLFSPSFRAWDSSPRKSGDHVDSAEMVNFHLVSLWLGSQTFPVILGHACFLHLFKIKNLEEDDR